MYQMGYAPWRANRRMAATAGRHDIIRYAHDLSILTFKYDYGNEWLTTGGCHMNSLPSARQVTPGAGHNSAGRAGEEPLDMLMQQLALTHRTAMSGLESVAAWSDILRRQPDLSPTAVGRHTEMIGRLSHSVTRMLTAAQRGMLTKERLETAALAREREDAAAPARVQPRTVDGRF